MAKRAGGVSFQTVREIGLAFPDVEDGLSYHMPALKVRGESFVHLRDELDSIVLPMPFERRAELLAAEPETYYITEHYAGYPALLVRLSTVSRAALTALLEAAYEQKRPQPRRAQRRARKQ